MREIKFRAWDKERKKIFDVVHIYFTPIEGCYCVTLSQSKPKFLHNDDDIILMQYTGLKDKDGKEIYEGDIIEGNLIKYSPLPTMGEVVFDTYWASFANKNEAGNTLLREINLINVIGNIYENPELRGNNEK